MKSTLKARLEALEEAARHRRGEEARDLDCIRWDMARVGYFLEQMTGEETEHFLETGHLPAHLVGLPPGPIPPRFLVGDEEARELRRLDKLFAHLPPDEQEQAIKTGRLPARLGEDSDPSASGNGRRL